MSAFDTAKKFFEACDGNAGWDGCKAYVAEGAVFEAQSGALADINTIEAYCEWAKGLGTVIAPGASYTLHSASFDEERNVATFFATYHAKHTGEGGPVPPTGKETNTDYVYSLILDESGKIV